MRSHMPNYRGLDIPFVDFGGGVTSDSLFCDKEQPLFDFYEAAGKAGRYRRALDIGANIGIHSMIMARQGWTVRAFEPDRKHYVWLLANLQRNRIGLCHEDHPYFDTGPYLGAVSDAPGRATFVRVKGNTTGSHLEGDKRPYGDLERFTVDVVDCRPLIAWADFAKIDCEGGEARILLTVQHDCRCEFMIEVGTLENAEAIYGHFAGRRGMWAQKIGWKPVRGLGDMPAHHNHGALFIGREPPFK